MIDYIQSNKFRMKLNIITNIAAFVINFFINFYISPLIVSKFGADAYGFIGLSNEIVGYISIIAIIFNSVGSRFIANEYYKGRYEDAINYYNALIAANLIISFIIIIIGLVFIPALEKFITIPVHLINTVKIVFAISFVTYAVSLSTNSFSIATFVKNVTAINGLITISVNIIRFTLIIIFLNLVSLNIYWVPFSSMIATSFGGIAFVITAKRLLPDIIPNPLKAKRTYISSLAKSGIWMSATSLGVILMRNVDLLIANQYLDSVNMGYLSIARIIPNSITSALTTIGPLFTPLLIQKYSKDDMDGLGNTTSKSIDTVYKIMLVPICGYIILAKEFTFLWQKELTPEIVGLVSSLSIITVIQSLFNASGCVNSQLSIVTNRLKIPVMVTLFSGIINLLLVIILIQFTNFGIYSIVISSTFIMTFRYIVFNPIYGAIIIKKRWNYFYNRLKYDWLIIPIILFIFFILHKYIVLKSWMQFIFSATILGIVGYSIVFLYFKIIESKDSKGV